jgi:hypothetical protein
MGRFRQINPSQSGSHRRNLPGHLGKRPAAHGRAAAQGLSADATAPPTTSRSSPTLRSRY